MKTKSQIQNPKSEIETPRYYLADVPHPVRARALDLCIRRLWHDALELLQKHGFNDYTQDDLISFYHWAPARLEPDPPEPEPTPECPRDYEQPAPDLIEDIRKRLADVPPDVLERVHDTLKHGSIEQAGSLLWHAGAGFSSADLYQYRTTLFPPKSLVDPYTAGPPVLRPSDRSADSLSAPAPATNTPDGSADSLSAPPSETNNSPDDPQHAQHADSIDSPDVGSPQLAESRQRLVDVLSARLNALNSPVSSSSCSSSSSIASVKPLRTTRHARQRITNHAPRTTENKPLITEPGHLLLDSLRSLLTRYVVLPELAAEALALWVVHTYAFTLREVTTYIGVVSPEKRCGKTTLLELLGRLANRSLTAANISPSALFRVIQDTQPTLLIDEADTFLQGRDELAGILNAGYRKGNAYVVRLSDSRTRWHIASREPEFGEWTQKYADDFAQYSCWCPKVMAAIGRLPDTLADRCILITMQRKMPAEKCERMRLLNAIEYRKRCADFVAVHSDAIANAQPEIPSTLNDRAADIWEPLLAIADLAGGQWPELARQAAVKLSGADEDITLLGYFLADLRAWMLHNKVDRMLSRGIIAAFNPCHTRPWEDLRRGREINEYWLATRMRELGIRPTYIRIGEVTGRGYLLRDIEAAFRRYVPNADGHRAPKPEQRYAADSQD